MSKLWASAFGVLGPNAKSRTPNGEGLRLRAGRHRSDDSQMRQKPFDLYCAHFARVALSVK
jgi:hypothetical protein